MNRKIIITIFFLVFGAISNYSLGQTEEKANKEDLEITQVTKGEKVNDAKQIRLYCSIKNHSSKYHSAWVINGECCSEYTLEKLNSEFVKSFEIKQRDTIVHGIKFDHQVIIKYKGKLPKQKLISLSELKAKYTSLGDTATIYAIENKLVKGADKVLLDENSIYNVVVDDMINPQENINLKITSILLRE